MVKVEVLRVVGESEIKGNSSGRNGEAGHNELPEGNTHDCYCDPQDHIQRSSNRPLPPNQLMPVAETPLPGPKSCRPILETLSDSACPSAKPPLQRRL